MYNVIKDKYIKIRIKNELKSKFVKMLTMDGITQGDFFNACILSYIDNKTFDKSQIISKAEKNNHSK